MPASSHLQLTASLATIPHRCSLPNSTVLCHIQREAPKLAVLGLGEETEKAALWPFCIQGGGPTIHGEASSMGMYADAVTSLNGKSPARRVDQGQRVGGAGPPSDART